jgi:hypothetical protein
MVITIYIKALNNGAQLFKEWLQEKYNREFDYIDNKPFYTFSWETSEKIIHLDYTKDNLHFQGIQILDMKNDLTELKLNSDELYNDLKIWDKDLFHTNICEYHNYYSKKLIKKISFNKIPHYYTDYIKANFGKSVLIWKN